MNDNLNKSAYNNYLEVTKIPHAIIEYFVSSKSETAENLWKLLVYNDVDALSQPKLTITEKNNLRYLGKGSQEGKKIFIKPTISESLTNSETQTLIKLFRYSTQPTNDLIATINYVFEFYTNEATSVVEYDGVYVERTDLMEALWLSLFNGKDIGIGSTYLSYNRELSRACQSLLNLGNNKSFYGRSCGMSLLYMNVETGGQCD